jgi:aspartate racemase
MQIADDWEAAGLLLTQAGQRCQAAGADLLLICSNLMHKVAPMVQAGLDIPLIHMTDAIAARADQKGWSCLGVLSTRKVMEEDFYLGRLRAADLQVRVPSQNDRTLVDRVIFDELTQGKIERTSRQALIEIIDRLAEEGADAVVFSCTEIGLLIKPGDSRLPIVDSMQVHAEAAVTAALTTHP